MPLHIIRNDITNMTVDAIVNPAAPDLLGGGGVDGRIHQQAGPLLLEECKKLGGCETGKAKITAGYNLSCKYIIHTVGPRWQGGKHGECELLTSCYRTSLQLAKQNHCESIAFPLISSGIYEYPKDQALDIAIAAIREFLLEHDMTIYLVVFDCSSYRISEQRFAHIVKYIDDHYVDTHTDYGSNFYIRAQRERPSTSRKDRLGTDMLHYRESRSKHYGESYSTSPIYGKKPSLSEALNQIDESFSQMLLRKIDEKGMTDAQCYKKANIDRKLFSKIRKNPLYQPSKNTVLAFAIALELSLEETQDMLQKAGFALSHSNKFDIIIEYFIKNKNYNIFEINETLFAFKQRSLGS